MTSKSYLDNPSVGPVPSKAQVKQKKDTLLDLTPIWIWAQINSGQTKFKPNI